MSDLKMLPNVDKLLNMDEAAAMLGLKKSTLYGIVMRREIPVCKIGKLNRFRRSDLDKWIESHIQGAS